MRSWRARAWSGSPERQRSGAHALAISAAHGLALRMSSSSSSDGSDSELEENGSRPRRRARSPPARRQDRLTDDSDSDEEASLGAPSDSLRAEQAKLHAAEERFDVRTQRASAPTFLA